MGTPCFVTAFFEESVRREMDRKQENQKAQSAQIIHCGKAVRETAILTGAVAIIAGAVYFF